MGKAELEAFLSYLAVERHVSASTQNQAKSALLCLYQRVLGLELPWLSDIVVAKRPQHLPTVLTVGEVQAVLARMSGVSGLIGQLLYGSGLRLLEACRLRVQDVDFEMRQLMVRDGKGAKDRVTMLPQSVVKPLTQHLQRIKVRHDDDVLAGFGEVCAVCARQQVPERAARMALAVCLSGRADVARFSVRRNPAPSSWRADGAADGEAGGFGGRAEQHLHATLAICRMDWATEAVLLCPRGYPRQMRALQRLGT